MAASCPTAATVCSSEYLRTDIYTGWAKKSGQFFLKVCKIVVIFAQCRYTKIAQRIFQCSDIQYTSLTVDKKLNGLIYRMPFCVNIYGSYKLLKTVCFLSHPVDR